MLDQDVKKFYKAKAIIPDQAELVLPLENLFKGVKPIPIPMEVGVEIEIENWEKPAHAYLWKVEPDHSLRNNGVEFVSYPMNGLTLAYAIEEYKFLLSCCPKSEFTHRCSIHVHMNVAKLTVGQLKALIATYLTVEDLFFRLVKEERRGNSYCYPLADLNLEWEDLQPGNVTEAYKYAALNPHHLEDYCTLEFRHHNGTKDVENLKNWILTIGKLYTFVVNHPLEVIQNDIFGLNTISNYYDFCFRLFGDKFAQFNNVDLYKSMRDNVTSAKLFLS
jgi:hypothetical protein